MAAPTLRRELTTAAPFALAAILVWSGGVLARRATGAPGTPEPAPWQRSYLELPVGEQRLYRQVREGIFEAENARGATKRWPEVAELAGDGIPPFAADALTPPLQWSRAQQGVYVTYLGVPSGGATSQRWLVLFIEPEPSALNARGASPPVDEEHHTLPDGTALHVTVWTEPNAGPLPKGVLAFPVAEGWTQRLGR